MYGLWWFLSLQMFFFFASVFVFFAFAVAGYCSFAMLMVVRVFGSLVYMGLTFDWWFCNENNNKKKCEKRMSIFVDVWGRIHLYIDGREHMTRRIAVPCTWELYTFVVCLLFVLCGQHKRAIFMKMMQRIISCVFVFVCWFDRFGGQRTKADIPMDERSITWIPRQPAMRAINKFDFSSYRIPSVDWK